MDTMTTYPPPVASQTPSVPPDVEMSKAKVPSTTVVDFHREHICSDPKRPVHPEKRPKAIYFPEDAPVSQSQPAPSFKSSRTGPSTPVIPAVPPYAPLVSSSSYSHLSVSSADSRPRAVYRAVDDDTAPIAANGGVGPTSRQPAPVASSCPSQIKKRSQSHLESAPNTVLASCDRDGSDSMDLGDSPGPQKRHQALTDAKPSFTVNEQRLQTLSHGPVPTPEPDRTVEADGDVDTGGLQANVPIPRVFFGDIVGKDRVPSGFGTARYPKFASIEETHHVTITGPQTIHRDGFLTITGGSAAAVAAARYDLMRSMAVTVGLPHLDLALHSSEYAVPPALEDLLLFVDYSNIACGWSGDRPLDIATLDGWMLAHRPATHKEVAGTMPPDVAILWSTLGYEVTATRGDKVGNVDEFLHAQVYHAVFGARTGGPGVLILATGDGNSNSGKSTFPSCVVAALRLGWAVEIVSWKVSLSWVYEFLQALCPSRVRVRLIDDAFPSA